jgi:HEAT repeat protein
MRATLVPRSPRFIAHIVFTPTLRSTSCMAQRTALAALLSIGCMTGRQALAQATEPASPDGKTVQQPAVVVKTPAQLKDQAWTMLNEAVTDEKHPDLRVQALAALGLLGANPHSLKLIEGSMKDKDLDVRTASVLAAGQSKSVLVTSSLRQMLDDKEPGVAFAAAMTLWKMHDRSGEDILMAVADGDQGTSSTFINGTTHHISTNLHHPGAMARFGAMQGAYMLLGPFGYGLTAFEYLHKNGGDAARVSAIEAIAQNHTAPIRTALITSLGDKDLGVRAAAAQALARYRDPAVAVELAKLFDDSKPPVRFTAAAAYLISSGTVAAPPEAGATPTRAKKN